MALPIAQTVSDTRLVDMIRLGYRSSQDHGNLGFMRELKERHGETVEPRAEEKEPETRHFLYFSAPEGAERAARELEGRGYAVEWYEAEEGEWSVVARGALETDPAVREGLWEEMDEVARRHGGAYDGHESGPF